MRSGSLERNVVHPMIRSLGAVLVVIAGSCGSHDVLAPGTDMHWIDADIVVALDLRCDDGENLRISRPTPRGSYTVAHYARETEVVARCEASREVIAGLERAASIRAVRTLTLVEAARLRASGGARRCEFSMEDCWNAAPGPNVIQLFVPANPSTGIVWVDGYRAWEVDLPRSVLDTLRAGCGGATSRLGSDGTPTGSADEPLSSRE